MISQPNSLDVVERIDVVRGPASPVYGPSKIAGSVNIDPFVADPVDDAPTRRFRAELGFFDRFEAQAQYDFAIGAAAGVSLDFPVGVQKSYPLSAEATHPRSNARYVPARAET